MTLGTHIHNDFNPSESGQYNFYFKWNDHEDNVVTIDYSVSDHSWEENDGQIFFSEDTYFDISEVLFEGEYINKYDTQKIKLIIESWMN